MQFSLADLIQIIGGILTLVGVYIALNNKVNSMTTKFTIYKEDSEKKFEENKQMHEKLDVKVDNELKELTKLDLERTLVLQENTIAIKELRETLKELKADMKQRKTA